MNTAALLSPYHADRVLAWENGHPMAAFFRMWGPSPTCFLKNPRSSIWLTTAIGFWSDSPQHWSEDKSHCFLLAARRAPRPSSLKNMATAIA
jgi:hypothetical protein